MSMINYASREINCKIVYYGPGLGGKTTNLEIVYSKVQPDTRGKLISRLYLEEAVDIAQELYVGFVLDRKEERVMIVASAAGGMEIEDIVEKAPNSILRTSVDPGVGMQRFQAREIAFGLGLDHNLIGKATETIFSCYQVFRDYDASMLERLHYRQC